MPNNKTLETRIKSEVVDLANALSGLTASFNKLRPPLVESHEQVPQATDQLDKINEQTEQAAQRLLDVVESITQREEAVIADLVKMQELASSIQNSEMLKLVESASAQAKLNLDDAFNMLEALQFQDITSQQMDHAASLLEDIEGKLNGILIIVGHTPNDPDGKKKKRKRAFDPHADMYEKKTNQGDIDSIFETQKSGDS